MSDAVLPVEAPVKKDSYFARHWRGELSLAKSWWVNGFLISGVLVGGCGIGIFTAVFNQTHPSVPLAWAETAIYLFIALTVYVWAIVGIWRSAGNYRGLALWKWLARILICVGVLASIRMMIVDLTVVHQALINGGTLTPGRQ